VMFLVRAGMYLTLEWRPTPVSNSVFSFEFNFQRRRPRSLSPVDSIYEVQLSEDSAMARILDNQVIIVRVIG